MVDTAELERSLRVRLAPALQAGVPRLSHMLADIVSDAGAPQMLEQRLVVEPSLVPLVQALSGQTIALGEVSLVFAAEPELERAVGMPALGSPRLKVVATESHSRASDRAEDHRLVAVSGGMVFGPVVGENSGTITYTNVTVQLQTGTRLDPAVAPAIVRRALSQPPLPARRFYDREQPMGALQLELLPRHGAWLTGSLGCGLTTLIKQAGSMPDLPAFADGVLYIDGAAEPSEPEDVIQRLYGRFYRSQGGEAIHLDQAAAEVELGNLNALFLLDRLRLRGNQLASLANTLAGRGSVLVAAEGLAPDTLLDLRVDGLPAADAVRLCAAEAGVDLGHSDEAALLQRLCAALECLPLPVLLAARLVRMKVAPLAQLVAVAEELRGEREPLARAMQLALSALSDAERAVLAALTRMGGPDADLAALSAASQLPQEAVEDTLARMMALRLVNIADGRYMVAAASMRRVLARLLPRGEERRNAALFLAGAVAEHAGSMSWLGKEWLNLAASARVLLLDGQPAAAGEIARAVQPYLTLNGLWGSWQRMIDVAEQAADASGNAALRAWALHERGTRAGLLGDLSAADVHLSEARRLRLELGDRAGADATLHNMEYLGLIPPPAPPTPKARAGHALLSAPILLIGVIILLLAGGIAAAFTILPETLISSMTAQPLAGRYPLLVTFDASASSTSGRGPLTYIWDFGDGTTLTTSESRANHLYAAPGSYKATLRLRGSGDVLSEPAAVTIEVGNTPPRLAIELPASTVRFAAGQALTLRGSATDDEDGRLADQALRWTVLLRQPGRPPVMLAERTGNNIEFRAPAPEDLELMVNSSIQIGLAATDSKASTGVVSEVLQPDLARATFATEPPGLHLALNGRAIAAPHALELWKGSTLHVDVPEQVDASGRSLAFERWSDGGTAAHTIAITNATAIYTATFAPLAIAFEGTAFTADEGAGAASIAIVLSSPSAHPITIAYASGSGSATAGSDYTPVSDTLTFAPGETSKSITIALADDGLDEPDETIPLSLSIAGTDIANPQSEATLTIHDNDPQPVLTLGDVPARVPEATASLSIAIGLDRPSAQTVTVGYATGDGSATAGQDYTATSGTLTFAPGQTSQTIDVPILQDELSEADESFGLTLSTPGNATLGERAAATISIADDDELPSVAIGSSKLTRNENEGPAPVVVTLSAASGQPVTVGYATSDGSATAGQDYTATSGTLTFAPGQTSQTIDVPIGDDSTDEEDEQFQVTIDRPGAARLGDSVRAEITIQDNDPPPTVQFTQANFPINENVGTGAIGVGLSEPSGKTVTVKYSIGAQSRIAKAFGGTLTFAPGEASKNISVPIVDDQIDEPDRVVKLALDAPTNATLGQPSTTTLTIVDDDAPSVGFDAPLSRVVEGTTSLVARFPPNELAATVVLSMPSWQPVTVDLATADGSALAGQDYVAVQGTLTFQPGETSKRITVQIVGDRTDEATETFTLNLANPANATLGNAGTATGAILDDDNPPTATFEPPSISVSEGDTKVTVTVKLSAPSELTATIGYTTVDGNAVSKADYVATGGTLTFKPGETSQTFDVALVNDTSTEGQEAFSVSFTSAENASKGTDAQITIVDDDPVI